MANWTRFLVILALAFATVGIAACASSSALRTTQQELAATKSELDKTNADLANARTDLRNVITDAASLKSSLTATQGDLASTRRDLTSLTSQVSEVRNSFSVIRNDVTKANDEVSKVKQELTKLTASDPKTERIGGGILALNLYYLALETNDDTAYRTAAARVGDTVTFVDDSTLTAAWRKLDADWIKLVGTTPNTPAGDAAEREWSTSETTFLLRLLQIIVG